MGRSAAVTLISAVALGCARTQQPPPPVSPAEAADDDRDHDGRDHALIQEAWREARCPDTIPADTLLGPKPDPIEAVALSGQSAYGVTGSGRLVVWGMNSPARDLAAASFVALSADGAVALTSAPIPGSESARSFEAWELPSKRVLHRVTLPDGGVALAVSSTGALLRAALPPNRCKGKFCDDLVEGDLAWTPPTSELVEWRFASGQTERAVPANCERPLLSRDGGRLACVVGQDDLVSVSNRTSPEHWYTVEPGKDWAPPPDPRRDESSNHPVISRLYDDHWLEVTGMRLPPTGDDVFVSYRALNIHTVERGIAIRRGWRLERWSRDPARSGRGRFTRLAESQQSLCVGVLAVSDDGGLVVLGGRRHALSVRRAPRYEPEPLAAAAAAAVAAVSADGARILSGHDDGILRLWDARTGALIASSNR